MRQIKYILIDDGGRKNREHHYKINSKGFVVESTDIHNVVNVIDRRVDPDGYNANSVVVRLASGSKTVGGNVQGLLDACSLEQREALKSLLVELRSKFPDAMIFGIKEIGDYFIKVSEDMNKLRLEMSELD